MMTIRWVDKERPDLEEALNNQLPTSVEVSPYELMLVTVYIGFGFADEAHKGYKHLVRQVEEYDAVTYALCGDSFFPSNIESLAGFMEISQLDDGLVCRRCSVEAEYLFYVKGDDDV